MLPQGPQTSLTQRSRGGSHGQITTYSSPQFLGGAYKEGGIGVRMGQQAAEVIAVWASACGAPGPEPEDTGADSRGLGHHCTGLEELTFGKGTSASSPRTPSPPLLPLPLPPPRNSSHGGRAGRRAWKGGSAVCPLSGQGGAGEGQGSPWGFVRASAKWPLCGAQGGNRHSGHHPSPVSPALSRAFTPLWGAPSPSPGASSTPLPQKRHNTTSHRLCVGPQLPPEWFCHALRDGPRGRGQPRDRLIGAQRTRRAWRQAWPLHTRKPTAPAIAGVGPPPLEDPVPGARRPPCVPERAGPRTHRGGLYPPSGLRARPA